MGGRGWRLTLEEGPNYGGEVHGNGTSGEQAFSKVLEFGGEDSKQRLIGEAREHLLTEVRESGSNQRCEFKFDVERVLSSFVDLRARSVFFYFMGRVPSGIKLQRWARK